MNDDVETFGEVEVQAVAAIEPAMDLPAPKAPKAPKKKAPAKKKAAGKPKAKVKAKGTTAKKASAKAQKAKADTKTEKDNFGLRKGSAKSRAAAMYARKNGATLAEVKDAIGTIQLNVLNELEEAGWPVERAKEERKGHRPVTRYWLKSKR
jgi:hypothetical protein